ncbi:MAG: ribosome modulation factor [Pseudomonadales bacterium]|nr:ribosome modulation factor [Pseudomonadales bacterium]
MKRHKRNKTDRAFARGYQVGIHGKSKDLCPYQDADTKQAWLGGWRAGREDNWNGLVGTAGVGRSPLA